MKTMPGISSVVYFCGRLGISWEDIGGDERLMHAFETACRQEAEWHDKHCGV